MTPTSEAPSHDGASLSRCPIQRRSMPAAEPPPRSLCVARALRCDVGDAALGEEGTRGDTTGLEDRKSLGRPVT